MQQANLKALTENQYVAGFGKEGLLHQASAASNEPFEDRHSEMAFKIPLKGSDVYMFGVYDGHSGYHCADLIKELLPQYIATRLLKLGSQGDIAKVIEDAFVTLDDDLLKVAVGKEFAKLESTVLPALSGAVVLQTVLFDNHLYVGGTGDVRCVLGTRKDGVLTTVPLSTDHNAQNPDEVKRMRSEHPVEEHGNLLRHNRVLGGLQPTRSFGDAVYKYTVQQMESLSKDLVKKEPSFGKDEGGRDALVKSLRWKSKEIYKTPPYVTARPEVKHHQLTDGDEFIIIASDGLWDDLDSKHAVEYVDEFLRKSKEGKLGYDEKGLNAASYLMKKAVEAVREDLSHRTSSKIFDEDIWASPPPYSRQIRDDITITVVFFDHNRVPTQVSSTSEIVYGIEPKEVDGSLQKSWPERAKNLGKAML
jgi:pyruvate dehydrogenase phosphatase